MYPYENIDRALTIEFRPEGLPRAIIPRLYEVARADEPLTYRAAKELHVLPTGSRIAMVTGVTLPGYLPHGEIDGPIGSVVLGHALRQLGHQVDVLVEEAIVPVVEALKRTISGDFGVVNTSRFSEEELVRSADTYAAAITVEKLGKNAAGVRHSIMGTPLDPEEPSLDGFIERLNELGRLTIGMGDGGNEMGFGAIYDQARAIVPRGSDCGCPCHQGLVTRTATKILLPVNVSNFGAYGITAALAILTGRPDLMPDGDTVIALIRSAMAEGCLDGGTVDPSFVGDDGIPERGVRAFVDILKTIVDQAFATFDRHF